MRIFLLMLISIFFTGCVTMLPQVKDEYLAEKTKDQEAVLNKIEDEIIDINNQKAGIEKKINLSKQLIKVNEKENPFQKSRLNYHKEMQELYLLTENNVKIPQNSEIIKQIDLDIKLNLLMNDYLKITRNYHQSSLELNYAQLSAKIAELEFEKSKIASAYIELKTPKPDPAAEKDPKKQKQENKNPVNVSEYQKQLDERKKIVSDKKAANDKLLNDLNSFEKKIKDEGFTINNEFIVK